MATKQSMNWKDVWFRRDGTGRPSHALPGRRLKRKQDAEERLDGTAAFKKGRKRGRTVKAEGRCSFAVDLGWGKNGSWSRDIS